ncbi:hypothetical protein P3S67_028151 [Capsicum chacoense]
MSSSVNLPPSFETSKFGEPDGQKDSVKHLGRHCNQPRKTEGKKKENTPIVMPGPKQSLRGPTHQYCQPQSRAYILDPHNHLQQGFFPQNPRNLIPLPQYPLNNVQLYAHPSSYPQWHAPIPQHRPWPPQIYQGTSNSKFHLRLEFAKRRKEKDNFTSIGESYASIFQRLVQQGMITPLLGYTPDPYSRSFDPNVRSVYHSDF